MKNSPETLGRRTRHSRSALLLTALAAIWLASFRPASGQAVYTATWLGTLPSGSWADAQGINASGQVVGSADTFTGSDGYVHAFRWMKGAMADLGTLTSGGVHSGATAISAGGRVVGWSYTDEAIHAFLWQDGAMIDLHSLGVWSFAHGVNDSGQVVGEFLTDWPTWRTHAFLWQNGVMTDLGTLGDSDTVAVGINASGQVVGYYYVSTSGEYRPFLWQNGVMTDLGTLGAWGFAAAINDAGQAVGISDTGSCVTHDGVWTSDYHAVLWENGAIRDLGNFGCGYGTYASGISNSGKIVGGVDLCEPDLGCYQASAFLYDGGVKTDLNNLLPGLGLTSAVGVNDRGQIVANGLNGAYRLDPGPCPPAIGRMSPSHGRAAFQRPCLVPPPPILGSSGPSSLIRQR